MLFRANMITLSAHEPLIYSEPTLRRTRNRAGRMVYVLQDGTAVQHAVVNGNEHIFMPVDKCVLSMVSPNPKPELLTRVIHFNHRGDDCSMHNMCWATRQQQKDYYKATRELLTDPAYRRERFASVAHRMRMRRYREAQEMMKRFGSLGNMRLWYDYPTTCILRGHMAAGLAAGTT